MAHGFPLGDRVECYKNNKYIFRLFVNSLGGEFHELIICLQPKNENASKSFEIVKNSLIGTESPLSYSMVIYCNPHSKKLKVIVWTGNFKYESEEIDRSKIDEAILPVRVYPRCMPNCKSMSEMTVEATVVDEENTPLLVTGAVVIRFTRPEQLMETRPAVEHTDATEDNTATRTDPKTDEAND